MSVADEIAARFHNDGTVWEDDSGAGLGFVCAMASVSQIAGVDPDHHRYVFEDMSAITICGAAWDLGYPDCMCWQGVGHSGTECPLSPDYEVGP